MRQADKCLNFLRVSQVNFQNAIDQRPGQPCFGKYFLLNHLLKD